MDDFGVGEHKHAYQVMRADPVPPHPTLFIPPPTTSSPPIAVLPSTSTLPPPPPPPHPHAPPPEHPVLPIADPGSGAHENCSATCVLSHPMRSATLYLVILYSIVALATLLLILVKALRGDAPVPSDNDSSASSTSAAATFASPLPPSYTSTYNTAVALPSSSALHAHTTSPLLSTPRTTPPPSSFPPLESLPSLLHSLESTLESSDVIHTLASVTPKVPDDGDMVSAMIMLMWGLSPLVSAVLTISWTYYTYREKEGEGEGGEGGVHTHHHHPRLVNTSPPLSSDEEGGPFQLYPPSVGQGSPTTHSHTVVEEEVVQEEVVEEEEVPVGAMLPPPLRNVRSQTAVVTTSTKRIAVSSPSPLSAATPTPTVASLTPSAGDASASPTDLLSPASLFRALPPLPSLGRGNRSMTAPSAPVAHVEAVTVRTRCRRPHTVNPFYSRVSAPRPRWWFVPTTRQQFWSLYVPAKRFLIRCYFLPILIPTVAAVAQYVFAGACGFTGWLSSGFVPTLAEALSLPVGNAGEVWAVVLSFFYELFFGCWWDPFPPGSADWGKGMNFHGASWLALSAMEEIGWAGLLFPCLYELFPNNPTKASIITGVFWSAWHWPFLVFGQLGWLPDSAAYHPGLLSTPFVYGFITFTLSTTFSRVIMVRLLFWSDDLWSQCVYHAAHNVMVFNFFAQLPETRSDEFPHAGLFIAEAGVPVNAIYIAVAAWTIKTWYDADAVRLLEERLRAGVGATGGGRSGSGGGLELGGGETGGVSPVAAQRGFQAMSPIAEEVVGEGWGMSAEERKEREQEEREVVGGVKKGGYSGRGVVVDGGGAGDFSERLL